MAAQRFGEQKPHRRELRDQLISGRTQVVHHVPARRQEEWQENHLDRTGGNTGGPARRDARLREFQIRNLHDRVSPALPQRIGNRVKFRVGLGPATAVRDEQKGPLPLVGIRWWCGDHSYRFSLESFSLVVVAAVLPSTRTRTWVNCVGVKGFCRNSAFPSSTELANASSRG